MIVRVKSQRSAVAGIPESNIIDTVNGGVDAGSSSVQLSDTSG
jgi:hypothetical protein